MRWRTGLAFLAVAACGACADSEAPDDALLERAAKNRDALRACWRYSQGWRQFADPATGLLPRRLNNDHYWNAKDCAADNYPFMVLTAWFTDRALFEGPMHAMLATEQRLCNRVGVLPDDYVFRRRDFRTREPDLPDLIFGASEYVKDGLVPLTEWLGVSPWSARMMGLVGGIWKHADIQTEVGPLPSTSREVLGELMQSQARLYWMLRGLGPDASGDLSAEAVKSQAFRMAAYFLEYHRLEASDRLSLDDHACEVIGGLSEVYVIAAEEDPARHAAWRPAMHALIDRILEVGRDGNGLFRMVIDPASGEVQNEELTDNWGYNYNAVATVGRVDGVARYEQAVRDTLANLGAVRDYPWENDGADGIADALEGGLNLLNRYSEPEAAAWADHSAARLLAKQRDSGIFEGWYGDGNSARTLMMYALWKSLGCYVQPWRADVGVGAVPAADGGIDIVVTAEWDYDGRLHFDRPRHAAQMNLPWDYPRINQFPEWFTVADDAALSLDGTAVTGADLRDGHAIRLRSGEPVQVRVRLGDGDA